MAQVDFEFLIPQSPFSVNLVGKGRKQTKSPNDWKDKVGNTARARWERDGRDEALPTIQPVEVIITTYYTNERKDVDNVIKPILDGMKNVVYADDRQVFRVTSERVDLSDLTQIDVPSPLLVEAFEQHAEFAHIRLMW